MSRHVFPDGPDTVIEYAPDDLGERPPAAAVDVMHQAIGRLDSTASFIPAVHDVHRDAVLAAAVAWEQEGDWSRSQELAGRLRDAVKRYRGVA